MQQLFRGEEGGINKGQSLRGRRENTVSQVGNANKRQQHANSPSAIHLIPLPPSLNTQQTVAAAFCREGGGGEAENIFQPRLLPSYFFARPRLNPICAQAL